MIEEQFESLAGKVLSGDATAEEAARLEQLFAERPSLRSEFEELRALWTTLKKNAPLAEALDTPPAAPPPHQLRKWDAAVRQMSANADAAPSRPPARTKPAAFAALGTWLTQHVGLTRALGAACILVVVLALVVFPTRRSNREIAAPAAYLAVAKGSAELRGYNKAIAPGSVITLRDSDQIQLPLGSAAGVVTPQGLISVQGPQTFAVNALLANTPARTNNPELSRLLAKVRTAVFERPAQLSPLLVTMRSSPGVTVYSPAGCTANLTPRIVWSNQPGQFYDISIAEMTTPATAPLSAMHLVSPVDFATAWPGRTLSKDRLYQLRIAETGKPLSATELTFRTLPSEQAANPAAGTDRLLAAYQILATTPSCLGDALALLLSLPPDLADSDLALRLKLFGFGQLGYQEDFDTALARLQAKR